MLQIFCHKHVKKKKKKELDRTSEKKKITCLHHRCRLSKNTKSILSRYRTEINESQST